MSPGCKTLRSRQSVCSGHVGKGGGGGGGRGQAKKLNLSLPKDFLLTKARRFYLSNGDPLGVNPFPPISDFIDFTYEMATLSS